MTTQKFRVLIWQLAFVVLASAIASAQTIPRVTISGRVLDDSTSAVLQNVDVFIAQTTLGCGTDQYGQFEIKNVPLGSYEIAASRVGYAMRSFRVTLTESGKREFEIRLRPIVVRFGEVVVSAAEPVEWKKQLEKFSSLFFGKTRNAQQCKILNPEVLDFSESGSAFSAAARAPLEIDNLALGYHLQFTLTLFSTGKGGTRAALGIGSEILTYEGLPKYTALQPSTPEQQSQWQENRLRAYRGSFRHFLSSLVKKETKKEGFVVYLVPFVMGVKTERYEAASPYYPSVTGSEWNSRRTRATEDSLVFNGPGPNEWILYFKGVLEVEYTREHLEREYDLMVKKGTDARVSWVHLNTSAVTVNARGLIKEVWPTTIYGYWAWTRIADALPLDYEPDEK